MDIGKSPLVSIVVPTYCEAENLAFLVPEIANCLADAVIPGEIVVVDDDSDDGTVELCAKLADQYPLRLFVRQNERGLSSAVIHGMQRARGDIQVVMDADLSHPPAKIPQLLSALAAGPADMALGSRYVDGGSIQEGWGAFRWLNSTVATLLARPLTSVQDPMAGYFAVRRHTFLAADQLDPVGYKIALELIVKCPCDSVVEIPIQFRDRRYGQSKLTLREQWNYLRHVVRLYRHRWPRLLRPVSSLAALWTGWRKRPASLTPDQPPLSPPSSNQTTAVGVDGPAADVSDPPPRPGSSSAD